jgi:DNA helicase-2/ATP-dependent DNA helicase PcrA
MINPSPQQLKIFDAIVKGDDNIIVNAVAGSGKTTTIVQGCGYVPPNEFVRFLAFNKRIVDELKSRLPERIECSTFHSACLRAITESSTTRPTVNANKTNDILKNITDTKSEFFAYQPFVKKIVGLAKAELGKPNLKDLMKRHDVECDEDYETGLDYAAEVLEISDKQRDIIDFDDMLRFAQDATFRTKVDRIFVDEVQDLSPLQHALLEKMLDTQGLLTGVGDDSQAIYAFRGADSDSMSKLAAQFHCVSLPLSVSYRCARSIVSEARNPYTTIEPSPTAPEGTVTRMGSNWDPYTFTQSDCIVCRNTAPLVSLAFTLLVGGVKCQVLGRDIGQGLISLAKKLKATDMPDMHRKLESYFSHQAAKCNGDEGRVASLSDRVECLRIFMSAASTVDEVITSITTLFEDKTSCLTLSTIHKAKGLEWDTVYFLNDYLLPSRWAKQDWQLRQEANLRYVACTRAKLTLNYIDLDTRK